MTCKENCLYYEICSQFSKADGANCKYYDFSNQAEKCKLFKDKSKLIDLPCKVGDKLYMLNRSKNEVQEMIFENPDIRCNCVLEYKFEYCEAICRNPESGICQHRFKNDFSEIGKTVFLTREEAERALEEGENK